MVRKSLFVGLLALVTTGYVSATMVDKFTIGGKEYTGEIIHTFGNKFGIEEDDTCIYDAQANVIACESGKLFKNPIKRESSSTGTPGNLMYQNYIGTVQIGGPRRNMPGAGKRIDFLCANGCE